MKTQNLAETLPPPPSLMKSLMAGFNVISNHAWLVIFSLLMDTLLWLGPRVRLFSLFQNILKQPDVFASLGNSDLFMNFQETIKDFNFLGLLRTFPIGVPSLMVSRNPAENPFGIPYIIEIRTLGMAVIFWLAVNLLGIVAGALYFYLVAQVAIVGKVRWHDFFRQFPLTLIRIIFLALSWVFLLFAIGVPFSCLASIILLGGIGLQQTLPFLAILGSGFLIWLLMPLFFSPHGIVLDQLGVLTSMKSSFRVARMTLPASSLLILAIVLISEGMSILWRIPADTSWMNLVGILGHAFITTSLLASTFIFFRDAKQWTGMVLEKARLSLTQ